MTTVADNFPETRRAWGRLVLNVRSIVSFWLLEKAVAIAPDEDDEKLSCALAVHQHLKRLH